MQWFGGRESDNVEEGSSGGGGRGLFFGGGIIGVIHESLVEKVRLKHGKKEQLTVGIIDAQSVKVNACKQPG